MECKFVAGLTGGVRRKEDESEIWGRWVRDVQRAGLGLLGGGGTSSDHVHALTAGRMLGTF